MRYFVNHATRMTRTIDAGDREPPAEWTEVIGPAYDQFRKISKIFFTSSNEKQVRKSGNGPELLFQGIERVAKQKKKDTGCELDAARDWAAICAGYANYDEALKEIGGRDE